MDNHLRKKCDLQLIFAKNVPRIFQLPWQQWMPYSKLKLISTHFSSPTTIQHSQILSLFLRNRIQCIPLYQLHNSQALFNLRLATIDLTIPFPFILSLSTCLYSKPFDFVSTSKLIAPNYKAIQFIFINPFIQETFQFW